MRKKFSSIDTEGMLSIKKINREKSLLFIDDSAGREAIVPIFDLLKILNEQGCLKDNGFFGYDTFQSVFTWRYASEKMRSVFSVLYERIEIPGRIWVAVAKVQSKHGIISTAQYEDIRDTINGIINSPESLDVLLRSLELEKEFDHDVIATKEAFAELCKIGGGVIHHGLTSMDNVNNTEAIILSEALAIIELKIRKLLSILVRRMDENIGLVCMGWTHLAAAEPIPFPYRLAQYAYDLFDDLKSLNSLKIKGKGFKGAVGTSASYKEMLEGKGITAQQFEKEVLEELDLDAFKITNQTIRRKQDLKVLQLLSNISQSIYRMARDIRLLSASFLMEVSEPSKPKQKGSSAMAHKLPNPIKTEKSCSLALIPFVLEQIAWLNASLPMLERTLDDSANRRIFMPEAFLAIDKIFDTMIRVLDGLVINEAMINANLEKFGVFSATESLLTEMVNKGINRQEMHDIINEVCKEAW